MRSIHSRLALAMVALCGGVLQGQAPEASFEAISVKESGGARIPMQWQGPRLVAGGLPLQSLLVFAYGVPLYELADLPEWVRTTRYEINALASRVPTRAEQPLFLRALLAERFKIAVRHETQERPIYVLTKARPDGRLGAGLRPTAVDCIAVMTARSGGQAAAGDPACRMSVGPGAYTRDGVTMAALIDLLASMLQRPVVDKTGLTGFFDIELRYRPLTGGVPAATATEEPDLLTALQEQLGLKADATRGPVLVTVFDRIERPTLD